MTGPRPLPTQDLSISDDDLCASCVHCVYNPGDQSSCVLGWPGEFDDDHYVVSCDEFTHKDPA